MIFDSTSLIAIFDEIKCPELIDKIFQLDNNLVVPSNLLNVELLDDATWNGMQKCISENKFQICSLNSLEEVEEFRKNRLPTTGVQPKFGIGESDVLLTYSKLKTSIEPLFCVLDDAQARIIASKMDVKYMGLFGMLVELKKLSIISPKEAKDILNRLKNSKFRLSNYLNM